MVFASAVGRRVFILSLRPCRRSASVHFVSLSLPPTGMFSYYLFVSAVGRRMFILSLCPCRRAFSGAAQTFSRIIIHETKAKEKRKKRFFPRGPIQHRPLAQQECIVFDDCLSCRARQYTVSFPSASHSPFFRRLPSCSPLRHCGRFSAACHPVFCCLPAVSLLFSCCLSVFSPTAFSVSLLSLLPLLSLPLFRRAISFARPLFFFSAVFHMPAAAASALLLPDLSLPRPPHQKSTPAAVETAAGAYTVQSGLISGRRSGEDQVFFGDGQMGVGSSVRHSR